MIVSEYSLTVSFFSSLHTSVLSYSKVANVLSVEYGSFADSPFFLSKISKSLSITKVSDSNISFKSERKVSTSAFESILLLFILSPISIF